MRFPGQYEDLPEYTFTRLRSLLAGHKAGCNGVDLSIGEPKHDFPAWVAKEVCARSSGFGRYPPNPGQAELLGAIAGWIKFRYGVRLDPETRLLALNGTREGLFNSCLALCPKEKGGGRACVIVPNPFYQVYAAAAVASGAELIYLPATESSGFLPDYFALPASLLDRVAVIYICSPSNPQGAVASRTYLERLFEIADRHGIMVFADECYSEIFRHDPPPGALEVAASSGFNEERLCVFNSLSKRSNLPGLRSGFVAAGPKAIAHLKKFRAYCGAPLPIPLQGAAARAWSDESHVNESRALYNKKFCLADNAFAGIESFLAPQAGFFLWLKVGDGEAATIRLWREAGIKVLPGRYLGRRVEGHNPGSEYIRVSLTASLDELGHGLNEIRCRLFG